MKATKRKFFKLQNVAIMAFLAMLGFACEKEGKFEAMYGVVQPEYGASATIFKDVQPILTEPNDE